MVTIRAPSVKAHVMASGATQWLQGPRLRVVRCATCIRPGDEPSRISKMPKAGILPARSGQSPSALSLCYVLKNGARQAFVPGRRFQIAVAEITLGRAFAGDLQQRRSRLVRAPAADHQDALDGLVTPAIRGIHTRVPSPLPKAVNSVSGGGLSSARIGPIGNRHTTGAIRTTPPSLQPTRRASETQPILEISPPADRR